MNKFLEIRHKPLRVFNQCVMAFNIKEDSGQAALEDYLDSFSDAEKQDMVLMINFVKKHGPDHARAVVTKGMVFTDDEWKGEVA